MRKFEQRDPSQTWKAIVQDLDREPSIEEMAQLLDRTFPRVAGGAIDWWVKNRPDDGG
jgi:hypothetical protein